MKKQFEEVLAVKTSILEEASYIVKGVKFYEFKNEKDFEKLNDLVFENKEFKPRKTGDENDIEHNENYRQIGTYCVLKDEDGKLFFYTRKTDVKLVEGRLSGQVSVGVGGHINEIDLGEKLLEAAIYRELLEELIVKVRGEKIENTDDLRKHFSVKPIGLINDNDEVGRVHLGLCCLIDVRDGVEIDLDERENKGFEWMKVSEFNERLSKGSINPEGWTKIVIEEI